ncbi:MAG: carbohydrate ABC transporter permease [Gemmobacter sp.]
MTIDAAAAPRRRRGRSGIVAHAVMIPLAGVSIFPPWWMIVTSLRPENSIYSTIPGPVGATPDNYAFAMASVPVGRMLCNTALFAAGSTAASLLTAILAAYAFARGRFPFDRAIYALVALTWLVPFRVVMIPNYVLIARMGLIDTVTAMILPNVASAFAVMLLAQAMRSFPTEVVEATKLAGAGHWRILWRAIVPNLRAPLAALAILLFISGWTRITGRCCSPQRDYDDDPDRHPDVPDRGGEPLGPR